MEDLEITNEQIENDLEDYYISIIHRQIDFLYFLKDIDYMELYDKANEDKIKAITLCFEVIRAAQNALLKQIKSA